MAVVTTTSQTRSAIMPAFRYRDAAAAIRWLCEVFGFEEKVVYSNSDGSIAHAELTFGGGMVMLGSQKDDGQRERFQSPEQTGGVETAGTYLVVPDADAVYATVQAAGADVRVAIHDTDYGSREFSVKDPEGHTWTLGTYDPWVGV